MADANRGILRFAAESAFGVAPSAAGQVLRVTSIRARPIKDTAISQELVNTGTVADYVEVGHSAQLDFDFELTYGTAEWLALLPGLFQSTWSVDTPATGTDRLVVGTTTTSYTLEVEFDDITQYLAFLGCVPSSMSLNYTVGSIITGSMSFLCADWVDMAGATSFTGTTAAGTSSPMNTTATGLTTVNEGGGASTLLLSCDFTFNRNLTPRRPLGTNAASSITRGRATIEGNVLVDLQDATLFSKFEDHASSSIQLAATDAVNTIDITLPSIRYLTAEPQITGVDGSADVQMTFGAYGAVMMQVDRS